MQAAHNNTTLMETHARQVLAIQELMRQICYQAQMYQTQHPMMNDIVHIIQRLCHSANISVNLDRKLDKEFQFILSTLCLAMRTPWAQIDTILYRLLHGLQDHGQRIIDMANRALHSREQARIRETLREIHLPLPSVYYVTKAECKKPTEDICGICLESHKKSQVFICACNHTFGKKCFKTWFQTCKKNFKELSCPTCRQRVPHLIEMKEPPKN